MNPFNIPRASIRYLINQIPTDGCLLVFNGKSNSWRTEASESGVLTVNKVSDNTVSFRNGNHNDKCDLYVTWKEEL